jgi:alpha-beta hydrolase superfamily lysophospholipase
MRIKRLRFPGGQDYSLGAQLDLPDDEPPSAYALFAHCFTCTKNLKAVGNINRALTQRGIAVLRFDFTGLGESEGDFADTNFSSNVEDLIAAAGFLGLHYAPPKILIGHSLGGAAVMQAAHHIPSCVAVVTIAAPRDLGHLGRVLVSTKAEVERQGEAEVVLGGRKFKIKKQFFDDLEQNNMQQVIANLNKPLLICHSPRDGIVDIDNAHHIFTTAPHPKSFVALHQADHLLMDERDSAYVGAMIATWASKYL